MLRAGGLGLKAYETSEVFTACSAEPKIWNPLLSNAFYTDSVT
jgi:hypothetical protein